jgi:hypothetical protein
VLLAHNKVCGIPKTIGALGGQRYGLERVRHELEDCFTRSIARRKGVVILRSELASLGSPAN